MTLHPVEAPARQEEYAAAIDTEIYREGGGFDTSEAEVIAVLREEVRRSSQKTLAAQIGFSIAALSNVLNGKRPVTARLAKCFGFEMMERKIRRFRRVEEEKSK